MAPRAFELERAYERGTIGRSVSRLRLSGQSVHDARTRLVDAGFACGTRRLPAERGRTGRMQWVRTDGLSTTDAEDAWLVPVLVFTHADQGLVEIFPLGDPRERVGPSVPFARKFVLREALFPLPSAPAESPDPATLDSLRAFAVADDGSIVPKSRRIGFTPFFDPDDLLDSWSFADETARRGLIALVGDGEAAPEPRGG